MDEMKYEVYNLRHNDYDYDDVTYVSLTHTRTRKEAEEAAANFRSALYKDVRIRRGRWILDSFYDPNTGCSIERFVEV